MIRKGFFASAVVVTAAVFVYVALAVSATALAQAPAGRPAVQTMKPAPPGALPPMPLSGYLARPREVVAAVYEFAARQPQVLQYMPCYCGCEREPDLHKANIECFVDQIDRSGERPRITIDPMGFG